MKVRQYLLGLLPLLIAVVLNPNILQAQFKEGQKFAELNLNGTLEGKQETSSYSLNNSNGAYYFSKIKNQSATLNLSAGRFKLKSASYAVGHQFTLSYSGSSRTTDNYIDPEFFSSNASSGQMAISVAYQKSMKWIFPIKPKFGSILSLQNGGIIGMNQTSSQSDTVTKTKWNSQEQIGYLAGYTGNARASLYYWLSPKILVQTGITLAELNVSLQTNNIEGSNSKNDQFNLNNQIQLSLPFSSPRLLSTQYFSIAFLLR